MKVRIINHDAYGPFLMEEEAEIFAVGTVHEVYEFFPDTGEVNVGDVYEEITFDSSEYEIVEE